MGNFILKKFSEVNDYLPILKLWNDEIGFIFPIPENIFNQNLAKSEYLYKDASFLAYENDELLGFIAIKICENVPIPRFENVAWVNLFYVTKKRRREGIGSSLLDSAEKVLIEKGITEIRVGRDLHNFFPGIPIDFNNLTNIFLRNRGYDLDRSTHDLTMKLINYKGFDKRTNFEIRIATIEDKAALMAFMEKNFPGRWTFELSEYYQIGDLYKEYVIAIDQNRVIGFARINDKRIKTIHYNITWQMRFENLGGMGPLGVDKEYRKIGLSTDIIDFGLKELKSRGIKEVIIDWTGLLSYYQNYGFEVWKSYQYVTKYIK